MKIKSRGIIVLIALGLLFASVSPALAMPPLPSSFYGTVKVNGVNATAGTQVSAKINGTQYAYTIVQLYQGDMVYSLDVPGDDPATTGVIEGGVAGDTVVLWVDGTPANETTPWQSGKNVVRNLTVLPPAAPSVTIAAPGGVLNITWPAVLVNTQGNPTVVTAYRVFANQQPYFTPVAGDQVAETSGLLYQDSGAMGSLTLYFYVVRSVNLAGPSANSKRVGKFSYALVAGQAP
jgi:hypothetical protein